MKQLLIPIGIMVALSVLTWLVQQMKNAADRRQLQRDRQRQRDAAQRAREDGDIPVVQPAQRAQAAPAMRTEANAVDRFLAEIDRLRQAGPAPAQPTRPVAAVRPVAPAQPARRPALADQPTTAFPAAAPSRPQAGAKPKIEDLPVATVAAPVPTQRGSVPIAAPLAHVQVAAQLTPSSGKVPVQTTPMGKQLASLLKDPKSVPLAVILQEILGKPKCRGG